MWMRLNTTERERERMCLCVGEKAIQFTFNPPLPPSCPLASNLCHLLHNRSIEVTSMTPTSRSLHRSIYCLKAVSLVLLLLSPSLSLALYMFFVAHIT